MKAIIAAAGMGIRLHPVTKNTPKPLLDINGRAIIDYYLETVKSLGISEQDTGIIVGFCKDKIKNHLGDKYTYINNDDYANTNSMYSFYLAKEFIGREDVLYIESDLFFHPDILKNCINKNDEKNYLIVDKENWTDESMRVKIKDNQFLYCNKDIPDEECGGDWIGIAKIKNNTLKVLFEMIEKTLSEGKRNIYLELGGFNRLVNETSHQFFISPTRGLPWIEIDFEYELQKAREETYPAIFN